MASKSKGNRAFNLDAAVGEGPTKGKRSDQGVVGPVGGRYAPPPPEKLKGAATSSTNQRAVELLKSDTSNQRVDRSGSFFKK